VKKVVTVLALAVFLSTAAIGGAQSQLQVNPSQAVSNPVLEIPATMPKATEKALLAPFVGCWQSANTTEIVESRTPTGTIALPSTFVPGAVYFCWKTHAADGTVYFQPPVDGYVPVSEAWRQQGATSAWMHWRTGEVDPNSHRVNFELQNIVQLQHEEHESEEQYSCLPEGSEMECTVEGTYNRDHQPWFKEVDHFHMQKIN